MQLAQYLDHHGITNGDFARSLGCSRETVRRYRAGERIPDREMMERIALATGCKVTPNDFFGIAA